MSIVRFTYKWEGFPGAPGYTNIYATTTDPEDVGLAFNDFIGSNPGTFPAGLEVTLMPEAEELDETTGTVTGLIPIAGGLVLTGTGTSAWAGPAGMVVSWSTGGLVAGRRVRGRTFLVPVVSFVYGSDGTIEASALATWRADLATYLAATSGRQVIWSRPRAGLAGSAHVVTGGRIPDMVAVLRSRRD